MNSEKIPVSKAVLILVAIFLGAWSTHLTAQSLLMSYESLPLALSYFCGVLPTLFISLVSLKWIRTGDFFHRSLGIVLLIVMWSFSWAANSHSIYSKSNQSILSSQEIAKLSSDIKSLKSQIATIYEDSIATTRGDIEKYLLSLQDQILNEGSPGIGPKAMELIIEIEKIVGDVTILDNENLARLSDAMIDQVVSLLRVKLDEIRGSKESMLRQYEAQGLDELTAGLDSISKGISNLSQSEIMYVQLAAIESYRGFLKFAVESLSSLNSDELDLSFYIPRSVELKNFLNFAYYIYRGEGLQDKSIIMAFIFSLFVDLLFIISIIAANPGQIARVINKGKTPAI